MKSSHEMRLILNNINANWITRQASCKCMTEITRVLFIFNLLYNFLLWKISFVIKIQESFKNS